MANMPLKHGTGVDMIKKLKEEATVHEETNLENTYLGIWTEIGKNNTLQNTKIDDFSYSGSHCTFQNVDIGKFSNIADYVRIGATDHPIDRPTLHHFTYRRALYGFDEKDDEDFFKERKSRKTKIGHDTWIGHGALIKPDIVVGNGAVIGQGAVVTKNVPSYGIVAGNPAKLIRFRFEAETIKILEKIKWWHWSYEMIKARQDDFSLNINEFIKKYNKGGLHVCVKEKRND